MIGFYNGKEVISGYLGNQYLYGEVLPVPPYPWQQESLDFMNRIVTEGFTMPDETHLIARDNLIKALKTEGTYWNTRDTIQVYAVNDPTIVESTFIDLKNPLGSLVTEHGGRSFNVNGHKGDGVNKYLDSKFNASTATNMTIDSIGITHIIMNDYPPSVDALTGSQNGSPTRRLGLFSRREANRGTVFSNDLDLSRFNDTGNNRIINFGRDGSTKYTYVNGAYESLTAAALIPLVDVSYYINAINNNGAANYFCNGTIGMFAAGSKISEEQDAFICGILNDYLVDIGLNAIV